MKPILGFLLCVLSACLSAAEVTGIAVVSVKGSVVRATPRICTFDLASGGDELVFTYRKNEIPNHYFLMMNGLDFTNQLEATYMKYFKRILYKVQCNYKPESNDSFTMSYEITKGRVSPLGNGYSEYFLSSAENPQAGFLIYSSTDLYWINLPVATTSTYTRIKTSSFSLDGAGNYIAILSYHAAFAAISSTINTTTELAPATLVDAGTYTAGLSLTVQYN